jgi:hypothetical protein
MAGEALMMSPIPLNPAKTIVGLAFMVRGDSGGEPHLVRRNEGYIRPLYGQSVFCSYFVVC